MDVLGALWNTISYDHLLSHALSVRVEIVRRVRHKQRWKNMRTTYSIRFDRTFLFFTWPTNIDYVLNHVIQVGYLCLRFFFFFTTECLCAKAILNFPISVSRPSKQSVYWFLHFARKKTPIVSKEINSFVVFVSGQCGRYCVEYRLHALRNLYSMVRFGKKIQKRKKANV